MCEFFFFRDVCSPQHLLKCFLMHRKSPELIISAHIPLMTCSALLWSFLHSAPLIRLRPFSCLIYHVPFFFLSSFFFAPTHQPTLPPFLFSLFPQWGVCWLSSAPRCRWSECRKKTPTWRREAATRHLTVGHDGRSVYMHLYWVCFKSNI